MIDIKYSKKENLYLDRKNIITKFIVKNFLKGNKSITICDDSSFFEEGIIDSLGALELVTFLEETFGFRVEDRELVPENLDSIDNLVAYVSTKLAGFQT